MNGLKAHIDEGAQTDKITTETAAELIQRANEIIIIAALRG